MGISMNCLRCLALLATIGRLSAQTPEVPPSFTTKDIHSLFLEDDGKPKERVKELLGSENTNRFFYFPTFDEPSTPAKWGFKFENVTFKSTDGTELHGWFMPPKAKVPKGTVVFSHGNAGSIGHHLGFVLWLVEADYQVFIYDYRGFGKSGGKLDRRGMIEDVKGAFSYVKSRKDVDVGKLVSYGHSLGGAKSVTALSDNRMEGLRAVVIDGTFASYRAMARVVGGEFGASLITDELSPKDFIRDLTGTSLLVIHGQIDQVVPISQGKELFNLANEPKTLFEVENGNHGDSLSRDNGAYRKRMLIWLDEVM